MAARKIIWSNLAKVKLYDTLNYFAERNKSKTYSEKLYKRINKELRLLIKQPDFGIKTEIENVRGLIVGDYILFYEVNKDFIIVHTLWDCRQNIENLKIK
ncbi:MAG TPA: type II toxin-antitoxin system RelE/ParE family toxin [Paludibacter sp.]|nr:type II toxin-antitoxin system RelE/ParE family toxin [Paludibacter sp.]